MSTNTIKPKRNGGALTLHSHLSERNNIFYYRYKLPEAHGPDLPRRELRISLRTGNKKEALRIVSKLHVCVTEYIERNPVSDHIPVEEQKLHVNALRDELRRIVDDILEGQNKKLLSYEEIHHRMNKYLINLLDKDLMDTTPLPIELENTHNGSKYEKFSYGEVFSKESDKYARQMHTFENFDNWFPEAIATLVLDKVFSSEELSEENAISIAKIMQQIQSIYWKVKAARANGDFTYEKQFYPQQQEINNKESNKSIELLNKISDYINNNSNTNEILLSSLIDNYKETKIKDGDWTERNVVTHMGRIKILLEILGDKTVQSITREDMRDFKEKLKRIPTHRATKPEYKNKTINELLSVDHEHTLSIKTINDTLQAISAMFEWGIREELIEKNPARSLLLKDDQLAIDKKLPLTADDLKIIFFTKDYIPSKFKIPAYYWVPLIALYSGMRREEICQLYCNDIHKDEEIYFFDVNELSDKGSEDKHLKNKNARRKVPIHDKLISLGLLEYLEKMKLSNMERLFPELKKQGDKYGDQVGKRFKYLLKKLNIKDIEKKSFHSLRHSFNDFFKTRHMQNPVFTQLFGHEQETLATSQYGSEFSVKQCYNEIISKLHYEGEENLQKEI